MSHHAISWFTTALRIAFLLACAAALGWYYGHPLAAVALALVGLVGFWLYQLRRVQVWLNQTGQPPPDIFGIWGDLMAQIYLHQRKSRETEERLQATVKYLRDSFASMRDGVVMVDQQGAIDWINKAAQPLLGLRFPEDRGQTLTNLVRSPEFNQYFADGDYRKPLQYATNLDSPGFLRVEITHFGEGQRLLFVRDVSANVRVEEIRRDFVGNVSHEMRTPLTVISGYLDMFLADPSAFPESYLNALKQMMQQAGRMETLLNDLLWLSRIESHGHEEKPELLDVRALVEELREELRGVHPEREIQLQLETRYKVSGNYRELYSAVSNLVSNAIKYSAEDTPVCIRWYHRDDEYHLVVIDSGIGIDSIHFPRLTERFYRVDDSRSSATGGTGLGLAIVKHVAAAHGARLQIESEPGEGSSFSLVFPERVSQC